jgi:hypothetical protein
MNIFNALVQEVAIHSYNVAIRFMQVQPSNAEVFGDDAPRKYKGTDQRVQNGVTQWAAYIHYNYIKVCVAFKQQHVSWCNILSNIVVFYFGDRRFLHFLTSTYSATIVDCLLTPSTSY